MGLFFFFLNQKDCKNFLKISFYSKYSKNFRKLIFIQNWMIYGSSNGRMCSLPWDLTHLEQLIKIRFNLQTIKIWWWYRLNLMSRWILKLVNIFRYSGTVRWKLKQKIQYVLNRFVKSTRLTFSKDLKINLISLVKIVSFLLVDLSRFIYTYHSTLLAMGLNHFVASLHCFLGIWGGGWVLQVP